MPKRTHEVEPVCQDCTYFVAARRGLKQFEDGSSYNVTGLCNNPKSPLYQTELTGSFPPTANAVHHRRGNYGSPLDCFVAKDR